MHDNTRFNPSHGTLVAEGLSLDGQVYRAGDPVTIIDDHRNIPGHDTIHVLNLRDGRPILVPLAAVCWMPTLSEQRPGGMLLLTPYGQRFSLQQSHLRGSSASGWGARAIQVSLGSTLSVSHRVVAEEHLSTWAQELQVSDQQSLFSLQWAIITSGQRPRDFEDSDSTLSSCLNSPITPQAKFDHLGPFRRDSAVDLRYQFECSEPAKSLPCLQDQAPCASMTAPSSPAAFDAMSSFSFGGSSILPQQTGHDGSAKAFVRPEEKVSSGIHFLPLSPSSPTVAIGAEYQINYMQLPTESQTTSESPATTSPLAVPMTRTDSAAPRTASPMDQTWQAVQPPLEHFSPSAYSTSSGAPASAEPQHQHPLSGNPYGTQQHDGTRHGVLQETHQHVASGSFLPQDTEPPIFFRAQEHQTMGLTASSSPSRQPMAESHAAHFHPTQHPQAGSHAALPEAPSQSVPHFRPDLISDLFRRQTRPHLDILQARQQEQTGVSAEQRPAACEAWGLVQNAVQDTLEVLSTLRSGTTQSFKRTEQRLRQEVDRITAAVQTVRHSALQVAEIPKEDSEKLTQAVANLKGFIEYLGSVRSDMVPPPEPSQASAPTQSASSQGPPHTFPLAFHSPPASGSSRPMTPRNGTYNWVEGQTTPPPDQSNGMAVSREHQRILHGLAEGVTRSQSLTAPHMPIPINTSVPPPDYHSTPNPYDGQLMGSLSPARHAPMQTRAALPANQTAATPWGSQLGGNATPSFDVACQHPHLDPGSSASGHMLYPSPPHMAHNTAEMPRHFPPPGATLPSHHSNSNAHPPAVHGQPLRPPMLMNGETTYLPPAPTMPYSSPAMHYDHGPTPLQHRQLSSVSMAPSVSSPGSNALAAASSPLRPSMPDRRSSLPDRRLAHRARDRVAPYTRPMPSQDRKGSI